MGASGSAFSPQKQRGRCTGKSFAPGPFLPAWALPCESILLRAVASFITCDGRYCEHRKDGRGEGRGSLVSFLTSLGQEPTLEAPTSTSGFFFYDGNNPHERFQSGPLLLAAYQLLTFDLAIPLSRLCLMTKHLLSDSSMILNSTGGVLHIKNKFKTNLNIHS